MRNSDPSPTAVIALALEVADWGEYAVDLAERVQPRELALDAGCEDRNDGRARRRPRS